MGIGLSGELESSIKRFERKIHNLIVSDLQLGMRNNHIRGDLNVEMASNLITGALLKTALYDFGARKKKKEPSEIDLLAREILNIFAPAIFIKK